ncbi:MULTISPECIES: TM2 domain-containing protein [Corynebacterium]|uniref:TM2 domain n=1 Tax=Corynebacterium pilosum TaxID=35756 RepID=A0A376CKN3_9CORY|nr:TM2 domain-containing protein [Corynebacterium pilosum]STC69061.1 TM2 domain [Corynebacterium pilosum]
MTTPQGPNNDYNYNPFSNPNPQQNSSNQWQANQPQYQNFAAPQQYSNMPAPQHQGQAYGAYDHNGMPAAPKSKVVAALLAFFFGTLGIHNFYLGYTNRGIAQLVLNLVSFVTLLLLVGAFLYIILGIWVIVDFISILVASGQFRTDARGVPLD